MHWIIYTLHNILLLYITEWELSGKHVNGKNKRQKNANKKKKLNKAF